MCHVSCVLQLDIQCGVQAVHLSMLGNEVNVHARQGYGLTETCAASFLALAKPSNTGTVGPPTSRAAALAVGSRLFEA